ncbi:GATOR2 complex protein MIOS isoform X2 [Dermacentor andersoni]|uniref:GATOR2 complex protein MIOS isoform X2 n=1 Tax=Dermacentor andersoni TaxID=34620 RepID=UPI0024165EC1|nr:GATOR complex protein MIOS-like isoform X2 [Dermacentor andersoni]
MRCRCVFSNHCESHTCDVVSCLSPAPMASLHVDVVWCHRYTNRFLLVGTDIRLFQIPEKDASSRETNRDVLPGAEPLAIQSDLEYFRCYSCYMNPRTDILLAVGQDTGKVSLVSFGRTFHDQEWATREFVPKQPRRCNMVAWNPVNYNLLAACLDKHKGDHSMHIWDVQNAATRPVELGYSDSTQSLSWFCQSPMTFVSGMNNKQLRIYDMRDSSRPGSTSTKATNGLCVDTFFEHRIASFYMNQLVLWDTRNFEKPVTTQTENGNIVKIAWSPMRSNVLSLLTKDSYVVKLYDVQHPQGVADDVEPTMVERTVQPFPGAVVLSSFSWHPQDENRMLAVTSTSAARDYTVFDRITLNWSPPSELVWTQGRKLVHCWDDRDNSYELSGDTAVKMRKRALLGYGLEPEDLGKNAELCPGDSHLRGLWSWLDLQRCLEESSRLKLVNKSDYAGGVRAMLGDLGSSRPSEPVYRAGQGPLNLVTYTSRERERVLWLCGWKQRHDGLQGNVFNRRLEKEGSYARKAAIHMFNLRLREAITVLKDAATAAQGCASASSLGLVALSLSGYTRETRESWREVWHSLRLSLGDPYLQAMFAFLTAADDSYTELLQDCNMAIEDRVAFACLHLTDAKLLEYIEGLAEALVEKGNLDGVLLTGMSEEGSQLLQRYLDRTGDVQTVSVAALQSYPSPLSSSPRAQLWVDHYRHLLDQWQLWYQRCQFDCQWVRQHAASVPAQQVLVSCNFCSLAASPYLQMLQGGRHHQGNKGTHLTTATSQNKTKVTCCPHCRKPLPRCALCLTNMGTPAGSVWRGSNEQGDESGKLAEFSTWFTWCQSCRHGGHAVHLIDWFRDHADCPVTGCNCKCSALDSAAVHTARNIRSD